MPVLLDNSGTVPIHVPGFGEPIDYEPKGRYGILDDTQRFRHGVNDFHPERMTVREVAMLRFMNSITEKPDWNVKVFDEAIVAKWREETMAIPKGLMSEQAFGYCVVELRERAKDFEKDGYVKTLESAARCVKS